MSQIKNGASESYINRNHKQGNDDPNILYGGLELNSEFDDFEEPKKKKNKG